MGMKMDWNNTDLSQFMVHDHVVNGELMRLIQPQHIGVRWDSTNLHFRSSLWHEDGTLISASFKKFFNFGEQPELSPVPKSLNGSTIVTKLDGSTLIISKHKGNFIIRTRGTVDASKLNNGYELQVLKEYYVKIFTHDASDTWNFSLILEWITPNNQIVIRYSEVDFVLIGVINHEDYSLKSQLELNVLAKTLGLKRPVSYTFACIDELLQQVENWIDKEGVVLYSPDGQQLLKIKAARYLFLHRMKSELSSLEKVLDVWLEQKMPSYMEFYNFVSTTFDYELAENCKGLVSDICDGYKEVKLIIASMTEFVQPLKSIARKDAASKIISSYGNTNRASFCFKLLDNKSLEKDDIKKLMFQVLKKL